MSQGSRGEGPGQGLNPGLSAPLGKQGGDPDPAVSAWALAGGGGRNAQGIVGRPPLQTCTVSFSAVHSPLPMALTKPQV